MRLRSEACECRSWASKAELNLGTMRPAHNETGRRNRPELQLAGGRRREGGRVVGCRCNGSPWLLGLWSFGCSLWSCFDAALRASGFKLGVNRIRIDDGPNALALNVIGVSACIGLLANHQDRNGLRLVFRGRESDAEAICRGHRHGARRLASLSGRHLCFSTDRERFKLDSHSLRFSFEATEGWHRWQRR